MCSCCLKTNLFTSKTDGVLCKNAEISNVNTLTMSNNDATQRGVNMDTRMLESVIQV